MAVDPNSREREHGPPISGGSSPREIGALFTTEQEGFALTSQSGQFGGAGPGRGTQQELVSRQVDAGKLAEMAERERAERAARSSTGPKTAPLLETASRAPGKTQKAPVAPPPLEPTEELGEARLEFVDVTTGERRPAGAAGTAATGRLVATVEGATVEVDRESLASSGAPEDPRIRTYKFDKLDPMMDYGAAARREKAKRPPKGKTPTKPRIKGLRETFPSAAKAAKVFFDNNADFYVPVDDPADGIHEWGDGIDIGTGSRTKKLNRSAAGRKILAQPRGEGQIKAALQWVFSQAKGRRWDAVDWGEIDRLDAALLPNRFGGQGGALASTWRPTIGRLDADELDAVKPDDRDRIRDYESHVEIKEALAELKDAYRRNAKCIPPLMRQTALHRIKEWSTWARNPRRIPAYACEPDMTTGGHLCNYPAVAGELRQLTNACDRAYDPDWAAEEAGRAAPGFPDTSLGEADTAPRPTPALIAPELPGPAFAPTKEARPKRKPAIAKKAAPTKAAKKAPKAKAAPAKNGRTVKQCASMLGKRGAAARKRNREKNKATETQRKRSLNDALAVAIS